MQSCIKHPPNNDFIFCCTCLKSLANDDGIAGFVLGLFQKRFSNKLPLVLTARQIQSLLFDLREVSALQNRLQSLVEGDFLTEVTYGEITAAQICRSRNTVRVEVPGAFQYESCEWCAAPSPILQEHHYPVPKHQGGIDTVNICPQCHCEYHFLTDTQFYQPSSRLLTWFVHSHPLAFENGDIRHLAPSSTLREEKETTDVNH